MTKRAILVGAVVYNSKVPEIWEIIKDFFASQGCPMDYVLFSNYEAQVDALLAGHIHIAWNSPLAWVDAQRRTSGRCRAIAMRDTDRDRVTHILAQKRSGFKGLGDLRGKTVATGAKDSPQATLLPIHHLGKGGLKAERDFTVRRFDVLVGKHGDHIGGERDALASLQKGESDACAVLDLNWQRWQVDGTVDPNRVAVLATTDPYDHCNFTVLASYPQEEERRWTDALFQMTYDNPTHREMMDLEGLQAWLPGRTSGYAALTEAAAEQRFFEEASA
jgi:ABC-type phosphate/phosphonate transport system substrate-binding protein